VTPDGIEIRGYFAHFVKWRDVKAIEMRSYGPNGPAGRTFESMDWRRSGLVARSGKMSRLEDQHHPRHDDGLYSRCSAALVRWVPEIGVVGRLEAVLAESRGPDVVGIRGHAEDAPGKDQAYHHGGQPEWGGH
jgi:hypothetical protein